MRFLTGVILLILLSVQGYSQKLVYNLEDFELLNSITGVWKMHKGSSAIFETWSKESDSLFIGKSFDVSKGDSAVLEDVRLFLSNGIVVYAPRASGQNQNEEVYFKLIEIRNKKFTFENKAHDFPQRIVYHFKSESLLDAWIVGKLKGKMQTVKFNYIRQ